MLTKQVMLLEKGTWVESSRVSKSIEAQESKVELGTT